MIRWIPGRRSTWFLVGGALVLSGWALSQTPGTSDDAPANQLLLKDYRPKSIYKIPVTKVEKARFPVIDVHSHAYPKTPEEIGQWVKNMDAAGIEKTIVLSGATGSKFNELFAQYSAYPGRFEVWCGIDFTGYDQPGFPERAAAELERCAGVGARGVGELGDKGNGLAFGQVKALGLHPDDPRMDKVFQKCAELKLPVNLHVADPIWMYQPMDATNDGLMNALEWRLDNQPDIVVHDGMIEILAKTVKRHPRTTFIACHFANLCYDLTRLGELLDTYPNLYADISARYAETAPIPRFVSSFYRKYADRLLYGTDMGFDLSMYRITFRVLETLDEHFYEQEQFGYHWSMNGFGLEDGVLRRIYRENALKILKK